jgi:hypothetical protein
MTIGLAECLTEKIRKVEGRCTCDYGALNLESKSDGFPFSLDGRSTIPDSQGLESRLIRGCARCRLDRQVGGVVPGADCDQDA